MTSEAFKINHRATIYIYLSLNWVLWGQATPNTPVFAYDQWGYQDQPQCNNLHILDFEPGVLGPGIPNQTKHTSFGTWPVGLPRSTTGPQFTYTGFLISHFGAGRIKHTSGTWPLCLQTSNTVPQFTYTGFFDWALWGRPHQSHQFWHMTSVPYEQWGLPYNFGGQHFYKGGGGISHQFWHMTSVSYEQWGLPYSNWTQNHNLDMNSGACLTATEHTTTI